MGHLGGAFHASDRDQMRGDDGPRDGDGTRAVVERTCGQRRPQNPPGQLASGVDDVRAARAGGARLVAHLLQVDALAQIERERGQIGAEPAGQRSHMAAAPSRLPPYATTRRFVIIESVRSTALRDPRARCHLER